jgi:hypothetical protein
MQHRVVLGSVVAVAALGGIAFLLWPRPVADPVRLPAPRTEVTAEPVIENPLPEAPADAVPLPTLAESDSFALDALGVLLGSEAVQQYVLTPNVLRRFVVTVDNLPRTRVPVLTRPVAATPGAFVVTRDGDAITLAEENFARYTPIVTLLQQLDVAQAAALYIRLYPLLQQSYAEVGDPRRYFNDRVFEVIDHLLATPEVAGPIALVQPSVFYQFADPALESRSAGQKLLLRMGNANAAIVKDKLSAFRAALASTAPPPAPSAAPSAVQ